MVRKIFELCIIFSLFRYFYIKPCTIFLTGGEDEVLKLSNLEYLDLGGNRFDNSILSSFKGLSSLKNLDLAKNHLKGTFNMKGL